MPVLLLSCDHQKKQSFQKRPLSLSISFSNLFFPPNQPKKTKIIIPLKSFSFISKSIYIHSNQKYKKIIQINSNTQKGLLLAPQNTSVPLISISKNSTNPNNQFESITQKIQFHHQPFQFHHIIQLTASPNGSIYVADLKSQKKLKPELYILKFNSQGKSIYKIPVNQKNGKPLPKNYAIHTLYSDPYDHLYLILKNQTQHSLSSKNPYQYHLLIYSKNGQLTSQYHNLAQLIPQQDDQKKITRNIEDIKIFPNSKKILLLFSYYSSSQNTNQYEPLYKKLFSLDLQKKHYSLIKNLTQSEIHYALMGTTSNHHIYLIQSFPKSKDIQILNQNGESLTRKSLPISYSSQWIFLSQNGQIITSQKNQQNLTFRFYN